MTSKTIFFFSCKFSWGGGGWCVRMPFISLIVSRIWSDLRADSWYVQSPMVYKVKHASVVFWRPTHSHLGLPNHPVFRGQHFLCSIIIVGFFYSCQFIKSFQPFHSFWEEEDLSGRSIQTFQNDTIIITWLFSFSFIQATAQWHTFKTFMFVFINSSSSQNFFCQVPNQYRSLMTFRNKIQAKTFTWPDMSFYAR